MNQPVARVDALNGFWGGTASLLAHPPYAYSSAQSGLFGLSAVLGILSSAYLGKLTARHSTCLNYAGALTVLASQARILALDPQAISRLNTVFMVTYFCGGALGSMLGSAAAGHHGWQGLAGRWPHCWRSAPAGRFIESGATSHGGIYQVGPGKNLQRRQNQAKSRHLSDNADPYPKLI